MPLKSSPEHITCEGKAMRFRAPGRINLIGEHTDYNQGFVLPMAIDYQVTASAMPRRDSRVTMLSTEFANEVAFDLGHIEHDADDPWGNYPKGVLKVLLDSGYSLSGMNLAFSGDIPAGAGMSSSAAIETVTVMAALSLAGVDIDRVEMAALCQKAENTFVGVNCGIMDQFISALGSRNHALLIDCRDLAYRHIPLPLQDYSIIAVNSHVKHSLVASEYNRRREECREGVRALVACGRRLSSLRDATADELESGREAMSEVVYRRCRHVVTENQRVLAAVQALEEGSLEVFGELMLASHASLSEDYDVSCPELDLLVDLAMKQKGVLGARMTGGGFGGCTINLVPNTTIEAFCRAVRAAYVAGTGINPDFHICHPREGASRLD